MRFIKGFERKTHVRATKWAQRPCHQRAGWPPSLLPPVAAILALAAISTPIWAAMQTVTLSVPGMACAACPIAVKKALFKVGGVSKTDVRFERREAVVTFDDGKTNIQKLTHVTENAGYPSSVKR